MNELQLTSLESCLQWLPPLAERTPLPRTPAAIPVESLTEPMEAALHIPGHERRRPGQARPSADWRAAGLNGPWRRAAQHS